MGEMLTCIDQSYHATEDNNEDQVVHEEKQDVADLQVTGTVSVCNAKATESAQVCGFFLFSFILTEQWLNTYRSTLFLVPHSSKICEIENTSFE